MPKLPHLANIQRDQSPVKYRKAFAVIGWHISGFLQYIASMVLFIPSTAKSDLCQSDARAPHPKPKRALQTVIFDTRSIECP